MLSTLSFMFQGVDETKSVIARDYVVMHNEGSRAAILEFINSYHTSDDIVKMDLDKHVAFYDHIIKEFGPLNLEIYRTEEESKTKLIINLVKADIDIRVKDIDPVDILQVEIDVYENNPLFLSRGLGLGALACANQD